MKFLELNKKRHAIKHFTDQPVDPKMCGQLLKLRPWHQVRTIANHGNSWSFARKMQNWQK